MPLLPFATAAPFLPSPPGDEGGVDGLAVAGFSLLDHTRRETHGGRRHSMRTNRHFRARPLAYAIPIRRCEITGRYCAVRVAGGTSRPARRYLHARLRGEGIRAVTGVGARRPRAREREGGWEGGNGANVRYRRGKIGVRCPGKRNGWSVCLPSCSPRHR